MSEQVRSGGLYQAVYEALPDAEEILDTLRRNLGKRGFALLHEIVDLTKKGIEAVYDGDQFAVAECDGRIKELWDDFLTGRLPDDISRDLDEAFNDDLPGFSREQFKHQIASEIVEFKVVALVWPIVVGREEAVNAIPSPKRCGVPIQSWFKGLLDAVSELAKLMNRKLEDPSLSLNERIEWYQRYLLSARQITARLKDVSHTPGGIISNSTNRWESYHKALGGISRMIGAIGVQYVEMLNRKASNEALLEQVRELVGR